MLDPFTGPLPAEIYPPPPNKRADTLAIKQAIAEALSEDEGLAYWTSLVKFLTGKLDRTEFEVQTAYLLKSETLVGLHNALILSILYNTTRPDPAISNPLKEPGPSTTGEGWHKRKRVPVPPVPPKVKTKNEERDPKKRKLKEAVMALGQRERNRLKQIALLKENELELNSNKFNPQQLAPRQLSACHYLYPERTENVMNTPLASKMKISSSTLYQDYMRCQQAPICSESKQLPDFDTLKDRMSLIAYDSGLMNGVDKAASSLALIALEVHLKTLLGDLLSLIRSDRSVATPADCELATTMSIDRTQPVESQSQSLIEAPVASTSARPYSSPSDPLTRPDPTSSPSKPATVSLANQAFQASSNLRLRDLKTQGLAPHLTSRDVAALAEISPHAFGRTHPAALERLIAVCNSSNDTSSSSTTTNGHTENHPDRIIHNNHHTNSNVNLVENYLLIEQKI
ncbi:transcriptional coactivator hfi1/ADA1 [Puccinia graminis f. sp. tritici]|uniref:Transcriptional coactivator hfi1/ADA1 n=1 Tax=Puccinia graminis f. sp. tritici TaxID=56615 RepID=A0A5B0PNJ8_PUCGR|nr:transcriptional coactivator hfi1/ADA1 [Puccinia graminis f. sp. tritici]